MTVRNIHFASGLIISVFVALHLLNHSVSLYGADAHIAFMNEWRTIYRQPIVEGVLLFAVLTQSVSGLSLFFRKRKSKLNFFELLHIWSGLYLAAFFLFHLSAVLGGRFFLGLDTNFYFGVAGLNTFPFYLFFVPYYALAILSFFAHIAAIHHQKMKHYILGFSPLQQAIAILLLGVASICLIFYGLTNGFAGVAIPEAYHVLIGK